MDSEQGAFSDGGVVSAHPFAAIYVVVGTVLGTYALTSGGSLNLSGSVLFLAGLPASIFVPLVWFLGLSVTEAMVDLLGVTLTSPMEFAVGVLVTLAIVFAACIANAVLWIALVRAFRFGCAKLRLPDET